MFRIAWAALAAACLFAAAAPACAAEAQPSPRAMELSKRLFADMHMERMMAGMSQSMAPSMAKQIEAASPQLTAEQRQMVVDAVGDMTRQMTSKMIDRMIPAYASTFSEQELSDLVTFYESPTGQAVINKMPQVMSQVAPMMTEMMPQMMADLRARLCAKMACPAPPAKP